MSITLGPRTFVESTTPDQPLPNAEGWYRYFVLHDFQTSLWNFAPRPVAADPEVNRIGVFNDRTSHNKVPLNSAMQFHWARLLSMHKFGRTMATLSPAEREYINDRMDIVMGDSFCLTNRTPKPSLARNYVGDRHHDWEEAKMMALVCGGNTVWGKPAGVNIHGDKMVEIYTHLEGEPFLEPSLEDPRTLWLTTITSEINVFPFTHLGDGVGVPYPLITAERYFYPDVGLQVYSHDEPKREVYVRNGVPSYA